MAKDDIYTTLRGGNGHTAPGSATGEAGGEPGVNNADDVKGQVAGADTTVSNGEYRSADTSDSSVANCNTSGSQRDFARFGTTQLKKIAEYETVCIGAVSGASFFTGTPTTSAEASSQAAWVAVVLKEFSTAGIKPVVFMEPTHQGGLLDAKQYRAGAYDPALDAFFAGLKARGVTDAMMGTWVPWPEANIPVWTSVDPGDFAANVTKTVQVQKKHFPGSKAAVLLQSMTWPQAGSWSGGAYVSLVPYVQPIPKGLLDSFGLQGFAWPPTSPQDTPILNPAEFLRIDFAAQAANVLGVKEIWFNTGTFTKSYVVSRDSPFVLSAAQRQTVLGGIAAQAAKLRAQGFAVSVHLFAKDKSATGEAIDWSYWAPGQAATSQYTDGFKEFVRTLQAKGIGLWVYDEA